MELDEEELDNFCKKELPFACIKENPMHEILDFYT